MTGGDANEIGIQAEAARIVKDMISSNSAIVKPSIYTHKNHSELFALAIGSFRYHSILKGILDKSGIGTSFMKEECINKDINLAVVLLYQHLVRTGIQCAPRFSKLMKKYNPEIQTAHDTFLRENNVASLTAYLSGNIRGRKDLPSPQYARVNLIKSTVLEAVDKLCEDGWEYVGKLHVYRFKEDILSLGEHQFGVDPLLEDVLVFPADTCLQQNRLVVDGVLVEQDRATCVPAHVLNPPPGSVVLDCCAAPGNKTSHLASLMGNQGRILAVDRDPKGLSKTRSLLKKTGVTCAETIAQNFLTMSVDSREVSDITMILLDPPCDKKDIQPATHGEEEVEKVSPYQYRQILMLRHALQFPSVQRVVYCAGSNNVGEGEEVAQQVMFEFVHEFRFLPVLPEWPHSRGSECCLNHKSFLRVSQQEHLTAGTFVACFERIKINVPFSNCDNRLKSDNTDDGDRHKNLIELYQEAAKILKCDSEGGAASSLVHSSNYKNLRQLFELVSQVIKYKSMLKDILQKIGSSLLSEKLVDNGTELALVLIWEELMGADFGPDSSLGKIMRKHKAAIKTAHYTFLKEKNASSLEDVLGRVPTEINATPQYARVDQLKSTVKDAIDSLCEDGWEFVGRPQTHRFKECVMSLSERQFGVDPMLYDVFMFSSWADMDGVLKKGILVLQDRASCVPAHVLNPPPGSVVMHCCAAPGNKTSHLVSLVGNQGRVISVRPDADGEPATHSIQEITDTCVETVTQDFLTLTPNSEVMADVTMIMLDPSCSCDGNGSTNDQSVPQRDSPHVLKWKHVSLLKHALHFPNVQRVVYYTSSANPLENEDVVEEVMCNNINRYFRFVPVLPAWPSSRGSAWYLNHKNFLRLAPENHFTGRLFVACFERTRNFRCNKKRYRVEHETQELGCGDEQKRMKEK